MSKYLKELNLDEKKSILEQYSKFMISEQSMGTGGYTPDYQWDSKINRLLTANSFKTGKSDIQDGPELDNALRFLMNYSGKPIEIIGGASAVGSDTGFDNKGLATKRAQNLINYAKQKGIDVSEWTINSVVGVAKNKGAEADAEQFVGVKQVQGGPKITGMKQDFTGVAPNQTKGLASDDVIKRSNAKKMTIEVMAGDPRFLDELKKIILAAKSSNPQTFVNYKFDGYDASWDGKPLQYFTSGKLFK
jgi:hypothetical protein